jgi:cell division control protein 45
MVFACASASSAEKKTYDGAYRSILAARRRRPASRPASVVLLVSPDVDALCAARMLSSLFKQDDVPYRIIPVSGYPGLEEIRNELRRHDEVQFFFIQDCGRLSISVLYQALRLDSVKYGLVTRPPFS